MSVGLVALLDDVAAIAKVAAASVDDVSAHAAKAMAKSAGLVIDDAAVTPRYVVGFTADRELPIIGRIAAGSLRNKLLILLPLAMLLSAFAPLVIMPLLMLGGLYLCYEGAEKVYEALSPDEAHAHEASVGLAGDDPKELENQRVAGAIRTDFILSAEIMAVALSTIPQAGLLSQFLSLLVVAVVITAGVYGAVALIVKADDVGLALVNWDSRVAKALGRGIVQTMPLLLATLTVVGTAAMIWVGGGIIIHGLESFGLTALAHLLFDLAQSAAALPTAGALLGWLVTAIGSGLVGLVIGGLSIPLVSGVLVPGWNRIRAQWR
ncbi:MAG: putative DNA repair protein MutK [Gammaproteobacteria bacterium]|jgi:predicted DNA repair protein MutK